MPSWVDSLITTMNSVIWSPVLVFLCLAAGLYFTIATKFLQVRNLPDMVKQIFDGRASKDGISSFQALMMSLGGRVGVGNIAGVATAIAFGGPGAVFWMWAVAFLGSSTSFIECCLGQIYKEKDPDTGEYRGGPAYYVYKAYQHTKARPLMVVYSVVLAVALVISCGYFLLGIQANGISTAVEHAWGVDTIWTAIFIGALLGVIVMGGVKRIANFAGVVVPIMAAVYILIALIVMLINYKQIPEVFSLIFTSAFDKNATFAGMFGAAIMWGVKRGIYSNEAGQGTGPQSAAAAEVSHPAKQGFVQAFAVYIDTLLVCSATAFIILSTGMYKVFEGETEDGVVRYAGNLPDDVAVGPGYVQSGLDSFAAGFGPSFIAVAIAFFAFTTILAYYYIAEVNIAFLNRWVKNPSARRIPVWCLRVLAIVAVVVGAVSTPGTAWMLGDIGMGTTAWLNIIAILFLQVPALRTLADYRNQRKAGLDPDFNPEAIGIKNADFWVERKREREAKEAGLTA